MKKILSVALAAQMLLLVPQVASAGGRRGHDGGGWGTLIGLGIGAAIGFAIGRLTADDRRAIDRGADDCLKRYSRGACDRPVHLPQYRGNVHIRPHERVYFRGQPNECRAFHVMHQGRVVETRYRCQDGNRWVEPRPQWGQPNYFDAPNHDPRMRRWDYNNAPAVVAPRPGPGFGGGPVVVGGPRPGFGQQRGGPATLPPHGGVRPQQQFQQQRLPAPDLLPPLQQPRAIR